MPSPSQSRGGGGGGRGLMAELGDELRHHEADDDVVALGVGVRHADVGGARADGEQQERRATSHLVQVQVQVRDERGILLRVSITVIPLNFLVLILVLKEVLAF